MLRTESNMAGAHAWGLLAALLLCTFVLLCPGVIAAIAPAPSPIIGLPPSDVGHFDPSKYSLPLPPNKTASSADGAGMNGIINVNITINSTHPTASYWNLEENPKYALPLPPQGPTPHNATVEDARMAPAESPSVSIAKTQPSTSAKIETVPGFVKTQGQNFILNGKAAYFAGTNAW